MRNELHVLYKPTVYKINISGRSKMTSFLNYGHGVFLPEIVKFEFTSFFYYYSLILPFFNNGHYGFPINYSCNEPAVIGSLNCAAVFN